MQRIRLLSGLVLAPLILIFSLPVASQKKAGHRHFGEDADLPAVLWRDPGDIASLNLIYGAGGRAHAPNPNATFTFIKNVEHGTSPKFDVKDERGVLWRVKLGEEVQPETAATRLLWAVGYFVDEDYFLPQIRVTGLPPRLHKGQKYVSPEGTVRHVRLERADKKIKKVGNWDWFNNPFVGTRELNGLRVMMALLNNWDLDAGNNSVYSVGGERHFLVSDMGATFGSTGSEATRSKSNPGAYAASRFTSKTTPDFVNFEMHTRPIFPAAIDVANYRKRVHMQDITKHIPRADAKWLGQMLAQLSEEQISDCFRAAGYTAGQVETYTKMLKERIAELNAL